MSNIVSIGTAVPAYHTPQSEILEFMQQSYADPIISRKLSVLFAHSGISFRHSAIPDFDLKEDSGELFGLNKERPDVHLRHENFKKLFLPLALNAVEESLKPLEACLKTSDITHLITVTCTGLYAPGPDICLMKALGLSTDVMHTGINFIGCNAAFPALRIADMIAKADSNAIVLIVCVELCTLHYQPITENDNILSNTIFGDGAAAVVVTSRSAIHRDDSSYLEIHDFYSQLIPSGGDLLCWNITPAAFEMKLDASLPGLIGEEVGQLFEKIQKKLNINKDTIKHWAFHPGGKRILDAIQKSINLNDKDMHYSRGILNNYGNMSSPTILFIINEIWKENPEIGKQIFAMGFGPGLSIDTTLLSIC